MVTVHDVPPNKLIDEVSEKLRDMEDIEAPQWALFAKTGVHKEKAPVDGEWWFKRAAAVLRTVYIQGPIGISTLRGKYGGKRREGSSPPHAEKGSGSIIRESLQQLETAGLVDKGEEGRTVTPDGQSLLDNLSHEIMEDMAKEDPELSKYL